MSYTPDYDEDFENSIRKEGKQNTTHDDFSDVLGIFNTPEYNARRIQTQAQINAPKPITTYKTTQGTVSNINNNKIKQRKNFKLTTLGKGIAITIALVGCLTALIATRLESKETNQTPDTMFIPDGYVQIFADEEIDYGESVYSVASKYYDPHIYGSLYGDLNAFVNTIIEENKLPNNGKVYPDDVLSIPVLVDVNNPCYQELTILEAQIKKITEEAYWIDHVVDYGDSLSSLAVKASSSYDDTIALVNKIMYENNLPNSLIFVGQEIKIVNPALGPLKTRFNVVRNDLFNSLKNNSTQK